MMCLNRKVVGGLAVAALAVLVFAPSAFSPVLLLLVAAACPIGMLLMMRGAAGACQRKEGEAGETAAGPTPAAAEITRLRHEVERLRAGQPQPTPPSSPTPLSPSEQE